ncbi:asparagine synthase-related protein [Burkholderiaceae bacterium UC74_6]
MDPTVSQDALAQQLLHGALTGMETSLEGISNLMPGERLDLHSWARTSLWNGAEFARSPLKLEPAEAAQLLRDRVQACASAWASCYDTLMMRVSGGIDSSILLSCLGPAHTTADVIGINYYSAGADSDERAYARLAALRVGRDLLEQERDPTFSIASILRIARMPDPIPYVGWMNAGTDARLAASYGAPAMFTGAGGDSLFYEFPRWWPAADALHNEGLNTGFFAAAMDAARLGRTSIWRTMALALRRRTGPNAAEAPSMGQRALLAADFRASPAAAHRFVHPVVQEAEGLPLGKYMQTIALLYPIGYYDPFEQEAAPEIVNPLLSQPLVELCLQLPTYLLILGGRGRALARRAFAERLPAQVIHRRSKGGMEEHLKSVLQANLAFVRELLLDGQLAALGLIDRAKLEELLSGRPSSLSSAVGQIHALVAIEAWLSRWPRG